MRTGSATRHPMRRLLSKRRGLLAGAVAVLGAGLAKLGTPDRGEAAHDGSDETIIHAGVQNTTGAPTSVVVNLSGTASPALSGVCSDHGGGTLGSLTSDGVVGITDANAAGAAGVRGFTPNATEQVFGVVGVSFASGTNAAGVMGTMEKVNLPTLPQAAQAPRVLSVDELPKSPARPDERPAAPGRER